RPAAVAAVRDAAAGGGPGRPADRAGGTRSRPGRGRCRDGAGRRGAPAGPPGPVLLDPGGFAPADPPSPSLAGPHDPRSAPAGAPVARLSRQIRGASPPRTPGAPVARLSEASGLPPQ